MRVILDEEESWSFLMLIVAQVLDQVEISSQAQDTIREWRSALREGTEPMLAFATDLNQALGNTIDEELKRTVRRRDYYRR
ncbi:MAG: hypothetical protein V3V06_02450 [Dehalococcoidia bacterium]